MCVRECVFAETGPGKFKLNVLLPAIAEAAAEAAQLLPAKRLAVSASLARPLGPAPRHGGGGGGSAAHPGGNPPPGLDSRPATSSDALCSASAPGHCRKVCGTFASGFHPSIHSVYFWLPRFFHFQEWSPFVKLYLHLAYVGGSCSCPPWQRGHRLLKGTEWGEGPLGAVFPVWTKIAFLNKSQVLLSGDVLYYDPSDACNGFPWPFCTEGLTSLQNKGTC